MLSNDVLFDIMLNLDLDDLTSMCTLSKTTLCNNHFWKMKIAKDFNMNIHGTVEDYKLLLNAKQRAVKTLDNLGALSIFVSCDHLKVILPSYMSIDLNCKEVALELVPEWINIDNEKRGGFIEINDIRMDVTYDEIITIYMSYLYHFKRNLIQKKMKYPL